MTVGTGVGDAVRAGTGVSASVAEGSGGAASSPVFGVGVGSPLQAVKKPNASPKHNAEPTTLTVREFNTA